MYCRKNRARNLNMRNLGIISGLVLIYMLLGILLNSVGTVILQSIATMGQTKVSAAILEAFKDLPIAAMSFLLASLLPRFGYRRAMILGAAMVGLACLALDRKSTRLNSSH